MKKAIPWIAAVATLAVSVTGCTMYGAKPKTTPTPRLHPTGYTHHQVTPRPSSWSERVRGGTTAPPTNPLTGVTYPTPTTPGGTLTPGVTSRTPGLTTPGLTAPGLTPTTPGVTHPTRPATGQVRIANDIATAVTHSPHVSSAWAVVVGDSAYVATMLRPHTTLTSAVKKEIAGRARSSDRTLKHVYVSTNPNFVKQLQTVSTSVGRGQPLSGMMNSINDILRRTFPTAR